MHQGSLDSKFDETVCVFDDASSICSEGERASGR